jgi:hypothetical protein
LNVRGVDYDGGSYFFGGTGALVGVRPAFNVNLA